MKKIHFILLTTVFALTSCDDILNVTPRSQMAPEDFFQTEAEMQAWTNTFYTAFPSSGLYNEQVDNIIGQSLSSEVRGTRVVPASGGRVCSQSLCKGFRTGTGVFPSVLSYLDPLQCVS